MATAAQWIEGARPRTLPAAIAPVAVGTGLAMGVQSLRIGAALLCLVVAIALQVGVNYANDYSDGIRGTDAARVGPVRLVGQALAAPRSVKLAAFASFGLAMVAGLGLVLMTAQWWLLLVGVACVAAGWLYTGGRHPYGYLGLGEVFVFVFFGLVPVIGTYYVQALEVSAASIWASVAVGFLACAILVANNLRDIPGDTLSGKRTLAVRLGDARTRTLFTLLVLGAFAIVIVLAVIARPWALLALPALLLGITPLRLVLGHAQGRELIAVLKGTGMMLLAFGLLLGLGFALAG